MKQKYEEEARGAGLLRDEIARLKADIDKRKLEHGVELDAVRREWGDKEQRLRNEHKNLID